MLLRNRVSAFTKCTVLVNLVDNNLNTWAMSPELPETAMSKEISPCVCLWVLITIAQRHHLLLSLWYKVLGKPWRPETYAHLAIPSRVEMIKLRCLRRLCCFCSWAVGLFLNSPPWVYVLKAPGDPKEIIKVSYLIHIAWKCHTVDSSKLINPVPLWGWLWFSLTTVVSTSMILKTHWWQDSGPLFTEYLILIPQFASLQNFTEYLGLLVNF